MRKDYKKAMEWYNKADLSGNADALNNIALLYEEGKGVKKDMEKAAEWYKKSGEAKSQLE